MLFDLQYVACGSRIILLKEAPTHFSGGSVVKNLLANAGDVRSLGWEDPPGAGNGNRLQHSCLENSMDKGVWQATVCGITESWTQLGN